MVGIFPPSIQVVSRIFGIKTETAKENNLDPYKYLTYIFSKAPNLKK